MRKYSENWKRYGWEKGKEFSGKLCKCGKIKKIHGNKENAEHYCIEYGQPMEMRKTIEWNMENPWK